MLKVAIMLLSSPKYLFSIEIEIYPTVLDKRYWKWPQFFKFDMVNWLKLVVWASEHIYTPWVLQIRTIEAAM